MAADNPWDEAEAGWNDLVNAAARIQSAASRIKESDRSFDGYEIERTLRRHRPDLMKEHLEGLRKHRKDNRV
ncbi:MAG TPA: hypothetical protein VFD71_05185 [Planctomycetota bacterium]|jgi:hypothetical protein|nr:hypothetical protein [Planctomycetota bacterium]